MGGVHPWALGSVRKQAEQAISKPVNNIPPWTLHQLLPPGSYPVFVLASLSELWLRVCKTNKPFPPQVTVGHGVSSQQ